mgnify:CR=1 FL=1
MALHQVGLLIEKYIFSNYLNAIVQYSQDLYNNLFSKNESLELRDFWVAHYRKGDFTVKHSHGEFYEHLISGCYYAYVEDNASPIIFDGRNPYYVSARQLLIFDAKMQHEVPVTSAGRRCFAMNLYKKAGTF